MQSTSRGVYLHGAVEALADYVDIGLIFQAKAAFMLAKRAVVLR